ncbi:MAG: metallophosphoesterase [Thermoplasmata archaeon]|jgi:metallophosphoesterase superfamily enzyme|nr:metallophosphoesterase [Thermoplasmata archaeon]
MREEAVLTPIPEHPALEFRAPSSPSPTVVVADLHIGLGAPVTGHGGPAEALARAMAYDLVGIGRERRAAGFLVVGDVKHPIVGVPRVLRPVVFDFFSTLLAEGFEAEVILGNHDVGLAAVLPREVTVHGAAGIVRDGVGLFHGHRWPSNPVLRARRLIVGHLHPGYRFAPTANSPAPKERCWVRAERPAEPRPVRRRRRAPIAAREVIVLPAFNPIAGAESLNRDRPSRGRSFLVRRFLAPGEPRAYLLDGTDLGAVLRAPAHRRGPATPRASTDR